MSDLEDMMGQQVMVEDSELTLSDLAGIDLGEIEEVRGSDFPGGLFLLQVKADPVPALEAIEVNDKNNEGSKIKRPIAKVTMECVEVIALPEKQKDGTASPKPEDVVGRDYTETFFISKQEDVGRLKAFLVDIGCEGNGTLDDLLKSAVGKRFKAMITKRFKKDDHDVIYTNLDRRKGKIIPVS